MEPTYLPGLLHLTARVTGRDEGDGPARGKDGGMFLRHDIRSKGTLSRMDEYKRGTPDSGFDTFLGGNGFGEMRLFPFRAQRG